MEIDVRLFVLPAALDVGGAERILEASAVPAERFIDGSDVMDYRVDAADVAPSDGAEVDAVALREHAARWVRSFTELMQARDAWFEQRVAHRVPLADGGQLLIVALDLDGVHDAWYEDVISLGMLHYASIARAMGVRLPGDFVLEVR
jgi:hypothetical protein